MPQQVLIIDDAVPAHKLINVLLGESGLELEVHSAYDSESGLALAASLRPDLVLLEADLPKMDGFSVCRLLKIQEATRRIPVIFLTAFGSSAAKTSGFVLRPRDCVAKPLNGKELCARVRVALRTKWLLDILPASTETVGNSNSHARSQPLNARISLAHVMRVRGENPWNRRRRDSINIPEPSLAKV